MPTGSRMLTAKPVEKTVFRFAGEKAGIFEDAEDQEIAGDAEREHGKAQAGAQFSRDQQQSDDVIEGDRAEQQRDEGPIAEGIEGQRSQRQPDHRRQMADPAGREIADQHGGQEQEDEWIGIEKHQAFPGGAKTLTIQGRQQQPLADLRRGSASGNPETRADIERRTRLPSLSRPSRGEVK